MQNIFHLDPVLEVRQRIFQLSCLSAGVLAIFVVVPVNLIERLPWLLNAGVLSFGVFFLLLLGLSRRWGLYLYKTCSIAVLLLLNVTWFFNGGSQGPVSLVFFSAAMFFTVLFEGRQRWSFLALYTFNVLGLYYVEFRMPELIVPYKSMVVRMADIAFSIPFSVLFCVLMMLTVLGAYDAEQRRLGRSKRHLERTLAEMRVLRGMLPICAACKRIRTDEGSWKQMELYIQEHSHASFTHGLCPECLPRYMEAQQEQL